MLLYTGQVPSLLLIFGWFFPSKNQDTPLSCITSSQDLISFTKCLDGFTVLPEYFDAKTYHEAQPTKAQRHSWRSAVTSLLWVDGNCSSLAVPPALSTIYSIQPFVPQIGTPQTYCVLLEHSVDRNGYPRGWGHVIVPGTRAAASRALHVSAPHPRYDLGTTEQATALFQLSGANSLLLAGRTRTAFLEPSHCVVVAKANKPFYQTDPAHNSLEPFFDAFVAIHQWQSIQRNGCPPGSCAFIQMHGKGAKTCQLDQIFVSAGFNDSSWYKDSTTDYPAKRLQHRLQETFPAWNISLPSDSNCALTASTNVCGRYINGVPESQVCASFAVPSDRVTGQFVHVEQAIAARSRNVYEMWGQALRKAFSTTCAPGTVVHPRTELCVQVGDLENPERDVLP